MLKMSRQKIMVLVLSLLLVIGVVVTGGCTVLTGGGAPSAVKTQSQALPVEIIHNIIPQEARALIQENEGNPDFVILDVRTPEEFADGHIEKAVNIDFYSKIFRTELNKLDKKKTYLVYCRSGSRSFNAAKIMEELKFKKVYNMLDGLIRWRGEELPLVK